MSFSFGAQPATTQPAAAGAGFSFGAPKTTAPLTLGASVVGQPTAAPTSFGAAPTFGFSPPVSAPALSFGAATLGGTMSASAATGLAPTATSAALNFGTTTTSAMPFLATGVGGTFEKPYSMSIAPATAPPPFVGLGGIDVSSTQPKTGDSKQDHIKVKETQVPDEIVKTVDLFKTYIKAQKMFSSEIGRTSTSKFSNVSGEIMNLRWALQAISNSVEGNYNGIKLLRKETSKAIQSVEMAQRTQDTPAGLQFENNAPFQYFQNLIVKYEEDLINFRQQITLIEHHMHSLTQPHTITPEDLKRGFQQINESFISLAGRLHEIHQRVEAQKEQYVNFRKHRLRDASNVFATIDSPENDTITKITAGPTPFSNISSMSSFGKSFAMSGGGSGSRGQASTDTVQNAK